MTILTILYGMCYFVHKTSCFRIKENVRMREKWLKTWLKNLKRIGDTERFVQDQPKPAEQHSNMKSSATCHKQLIHVISILDHQKNKKILIYGVLVQLAHRTYNKLISLKKKKKLFEAGAPWHARETTHILESLRYVTDSLLIAVLSLRGLWLQKKKTKRTSDQ